MTHGYKLRCGNDGESGGYWVEGNKGEKKWDNCNSIINKMYLKKFLKGVALFSSGLQSSGKNS